MGSEIVIEVKGLEELQKTLAQFPQEYDKNVKTAMGGSLAMLQSTARTKAPYDTGALQASIGSEIVASMGLSLIHI